MCIGGRWTQKVPSTVIQRSVASEKKLESGNVLGHAGATIYNLFFVDTSSFRPLPRLPNPEGKDPS
jgi:hypothetical protein